MSNETSVRDRGYNFTNAFDSAGNATTFKGGSNTYNSSNQNTALSFDNNGNPTTYASNTLTFDAENRMTAYGSVLTAGYRADSLRAWKTNGSGTTYYLYDGDQMVEELNGSGVKSAVMTVGPNGVLARTDASRTLLYTHDALGQMAQQIDASSGNIIASYLFDAWGARQVSTSDATAGSDPYSGYNTSAGYVTDFETGLQLLGHRYYDSSAGRFLNRDPIGMAGGVNVYEYVSNGPMGRSDKSGLATVIPPPLQPGLPSAGMGCWGGGAGAMIAALIALIQGGPSSPQLSVALCSAVLGCLFGALIWGLIISQPEDWALLAFQGCIAGAITSLASTIANAICDWVICKTPPNLGCIFLTAIPNAIAGCMGGALVGSPGVNYIGVLLASLGLGALTGWLNQKCKETQ